MRIAFGTSGWRGIIAREFTWDRVDSVVDAIAVHLLEEGRGSVIVGGDTRFLSPELAESAAGRFAAAGLEVILSDRPVPTPVLASAVRRLGMGGVVNFTASHNPFMYNGIKFSPHHGGPAPGSVTSRIETLVESGAKPSPGRGSVTTADLVGPYVNGLESLFNVARGPFRDLRVVYDAFNGTGAGILDTLLQRSGASVRTIHEIRDPLFAGRHPEPNEHGLEELSGEVRRSGAVLGVATDGDADRFGLVDEQGRYVSPHDFLALLVAFLADRGGRGACVRSVTTGSLMDRVAASRGLEVVVTPVGFKHLGGMMLERDVLLAGEESGGLSIGGHVPEKDGILACLLAAEMTSAGGAGLGAQLEALWSEFGRLHHRRLDLRLTDAMRAAISSAFLDGTPSDIGGIPVASIDLTDGKGLVLEDGSSVLVRLSGTEPLARIYLEAASEETLDRIDESVRQTTDRR